LRILQVIHQFPPEIWTGAETYVYNLSQELAKQAEDVAVFCRSMDRIGDDCTIVKDVFNGLEIYRVKNRIQYDTFEQTYYNPKIEDRFKQVIAEFKPDIVHFHHCVVLSATLLSIAKELGLPTILTLHDFWFICPRINLLKPDLTICPGPKTQMDCLVCLADYSPKAKKLKGALEIIRNIPALHTPAKWLLSALPDKSAIQIIDRWKVLKPLLEATDLIESPSNFLRDKYVEYGLDPAKIIYSNNGMDTSLFKNFKKTTSDKLRFGYVGSFSRHKGLDVLIDAFNKIQSDICELNIFANYEADETAHAFYNELKLRSMNPNVHFRGGFVNSDVAKVHSEIDVLIVPSIWYENSPLTIQEAYLAGSPVITSNIGGMAEYVKNEISGLTFAMGNADELARKIMRFIDDPLLVKKLAIGVPHVKTIEEKVEELKETYVRLAQSITEREASNYLKST